MRAHKASIQTAATKVTNIGVRLSSGAVLWLGREFYLLLRDLGNLQKVLAFYGVVF